MPRSLPHRRLAAQLIAKPAGSPAEAVASLGAVQAQDYLASLWAVGLRTRGATASTIEQAIADGEIVRTHAFRGTLQYVARDDVRWMLALVGSRVITATASRYRVLGLDERTLRRAEVVLRKATSHGAQLTRHEVAAALQRARIATDGQRLIHIIARAELDGVICSGARRGKQATFAAFDQRVPSAPPRSADSAAAELARRFFRSRGPATLRDFVWWTGLPPKGARAGLAAIEAELASEVSEGVTYWSFAGRSQVDHAAHLLPAFDEYLIGYCDRRDVLHADHVRAINAGGGLLAPCVVVDGRVVGRWRRSVTRAGVAIEVTLFVARGRAAITEAAERYAAFVACPLVGVTWA
jgi:hypothetical protein